MKLRTRHYSQTQRPIGKATRKTDGLWSLRFPFDQILAHRDEFEWFALLIRKSNNDLRREAMDLVARYPIRAGLRRERLNFRRNQSIHSLVVSFISRKTRNTSLSIYFCGVCVKEHIACSTVEDDIARLLEARWRMSIYRKTRGAQHPLAISKRGEI